MIPSINFITLGCAKNEVDSANMARKLVRAGFKIVEDPLDAQVIIINTCSFIEAATLESLEAIFDASQFEAVQSGEAHIVVAGCMPARYSDDLQDELSEVKHFVPCSKEDDIVEIVSNILNISLKDLQPSYEPFSGALLTQSELGGVSAYVKISDGCNRFCSFCTIPFIRGRYHSYPYETIQQQVREEISYGAREIVLIAQDTGRWGDDFEETLSLAWLLDALASEFKDIWFRVMYIQPEGISEELLEVIARHDNVCSYLDIPFQHAKPHILKAMNRKGSAEEYLSLVETIRTRVPDIVLRTTFIAGFPGESEEDFEALCEFVEALDFDYVGVFPYSQEEGTRAARLEGQIEEEIKLERVQVLRDLADTLSCAKVASRIGQEVKVLVMGVEEDGVVFGRSQAQAPEVDGVCYLDEGNLGEIVLARIEDSLAYEMEACVIKRTH